MITEAKADGVNGYTRWDTCRAMIWLDAKEA